MIRGTFANPRIKNLIMGKGVEGPQTKHFPDEQIMSIYDASMKYQDEKVRLVVIAGIGFGSGSSRDWAAKGQKLLGVKAVIAESFERIHRSNLIGMGILPLQFKEGASAKSLALDGSEVFDIVGLGTTNVKLVAKRKNGEKVEAGLIVRLDSQVEKEYYLSGGILEHSLQKIAEKD